MGGTADSGQAAGQDTSEDLVSVREAAQAVGVAPSTVHGWIKSGRLTAHTQSPQGRRVSLAAVRVLAAPCDPQAPPEAVLVTVAARAVGVGKWHPTRWVRQGLLPSWHGRHGLLVREVDVRALAQKQGLLPRSDEPGA